ncbi:general substrate transporter [Phaffia rhodozyma]|uniref:General substrate transporter n=1 Tax=Phaffia rhodozyma TaxID=264483 RepID=A0A0F7SSK3_PHARH|nr:general substrate transporter [Phaffia rhodozyma]
MSTSNRFSALQVSSDSDLDTKTGPGGLDSPDSPGTPYEDDTIGIKASTVRREIDENVVIAEGEEKVTLYVWALVTTAAVAGLLFGYDTGVISGTLVSIGSALGPAVLSSGQKELITSATTLGALLGGLAAGLSSDWIGRKMVIAVANVIFIAGAVGQACCHTVWSMIGCRFVIGLGVGVASCVVPLYIGELSPTVMRGRCVTINVVAITLGQVIAYAIGAAFADVHNGWRWMVGLGAVPAGIDLIGLIWLPESPRILLRNKKVTEAESVLRKMYAQATPAQLEAKLRVLEASVEQSREVIRTTTVWDRTRSMLVVGANRRALIIGCGLQAFQQLCGFNSLMYYSATLFKSVGFDNSTATGLIIAATNFLGTVLALKIVDPVGRRRIMVWTAPGLVISLILASISFHFLTMSTGGVLVDGTDYPKKWSALVLVFMITYTMSYATGLGNVPWQQGELFTLEVRGLGTSLCTATNWAMNLVISATFLSLMEAITPAGAFGVYAGFCFIGWLFCFFCYPETSGLSLEETFYVFENDFGIKRSQMLRAEKQSIKQRHQQQADRV